MRTQAEIRAERDRNAGVTNALFAFYARGEFKDGSELYKKMVISSHRSQALDAVLDDPQNLEMDIVKAQARLDALLWAKGE